MTVDVLNSIPHEQWQDFVKSHPQGNIFHTPEMLEVWRETKGFFPQVWAAMDDEGIAALWIPVHISLSDGLLKKLTTRTVVFGGALCREGQSGSQALSELLSQYKRSAGMASLFTEVRNVSEPNGLLPVLAESGFRYEEHLNYLINLQGPVEAVFNRIGSRTRQHIRKGIKRNKVRIEEIHERDKVTDCYRLLEKTYGRANVPLPDISLFHSALDRLAPANMVRFALAFVEDEPAAVSVELLYKDTVYGWYGGVDRRFMSSVPNELLMWNVLEWGCKNGYRVYDFGGAGKPDEKYGVRDFKAKFGGELVGFGRNIWVAKPALFAASKFAYSILRRILYKT
ncbi:MAG: GNAT family N-acetyltransferase [Chloroflexi bacterium]|nr:GNAT family N-acetyltransferase [Chloroflexota bacterium]